MIASNNTTQKIFYSMLFLPLLSFIGITLLGLKHPVYLFQILVIVYGFWFVVDSPQKIRIPAFAYFLLAFALYEFVWSFFNGGKQGRYGNLSYLFGSDHFAIFMAILIIYNTRFSDTFISKTIKVLKITVFLAAIATMIQIFYPNFLNAYLDRGSGLDAITGRNIYTDRRDSIFGFIDFNSAGLDFLPLLSILIAYITLENSKYKKLVLILGALVAFGTNTRYIMIGYFLVTFQLLYSVRKRLSGVQKYVSGIIIVLFILFTIANIIGLNFNKWYLERLNVEGSIKETERYKAYYTFSTYFPKTPILGTGRFTDELEVASRIDESQNIHMGYLRNLVIYGVFGCFLLFGAWFLIARKFYKTARKSGYLGSFFGFLPFIFSFATMYESSLFFYGTIILFLFDKYYDDKYTQSINRQKAHKIHSFQESI